jgi:hypothetical protein
MLEFDKGRIVVSASEVKTAILIDEGNFIQAPNFDQDSYGRLYVSRHGNMSYTWIGLTKETCMSIEPPFYVYTDLPCKIGIMEL